MAEHDGEPIDDIRRDVAVTAELEALLRESRAQQARLRTALADILELIDRDAP